MRGSSNNTKGQSVSQFRRGPPGPRAHHRHRLKGRLRSPRSTQVVLSTRSLSARSGFSISLQVRLVSPSTQCDLWCSLPYTTGRDCDGQSGGGWGPAHVYRANRRTKRLHRNKDQRAAFRAKEEGHSEQSLRRFLFSVQRSRANLVLILVFHALAVKEPFSRWHLCSAADPIRPMATRYRAAH